MSVRFRYRSSPRFETLDLGGAVSVSVRDLRARILGPALRRHSGLLISDAATNRTLDDDALLIPAGSDLVVKRVPIESVDGGGYSWPAPPEKTAEEQPGCGHGNRGDGIALLPPASHKFDDTSKALCPGVEVDLSESYPYADDGDKLARSSEKRYLNIEGSGLSEAMPKEIVVDNSTEVLGLEEGKREIETSSKARELEKMEQRTNMDSPAELRCFLCETIFEDAVMMTCCRHNFCNRCIISALAEIKKCPKCSSTRCTTNDLLPNLSLRKAIEHFLDDPGRMYAPDVESCIEANESSCALSIHQQEQKLPCSPSVTGKDFNQTMSPVKQVKKSSSIKIRLDGNKPTEAVSALPQEAPRNVDFQSASSSKMYQNIAQESEVLHTVEAKSFRMNSWDADGNRFAAPVTRDRKGGRTCYRCGSPNHLIRYCPVASNEQADSTFHGDAYGPPNWQGSMFHPLQPYANSYGTPGVIPFDPGVVPASPFGVPSYMPPFYGRMQNPYAFMGMRGMPSPVLPVLQQSHTGLGIHDNVKSQETPSERGGREYDCDTISEDYPDDDGRRSHKLYPTEKNSDRYYDVGSTNVKKRHRKDKYCSPTREKRTYSSEQELVDQKHSVEFGSCGRERTNHYCKQSASEWHGIPDNSIQDSKQRSKQHDRSASGRRDESGRKFRSDYSDYSRHQSCKEKIHADKADDGHKSSKNTYGHKHRVQETDYKRDSKVTITSQSSRHGTTKVGSSNGHLGRDRVMGDGRHGDDESDHYRHKRKGRH
ncbi:E3 ubiquitin-protein ligase RBBP6 isoform X2 [Brachypodium distachyon]|uniref:RING-type domain-containing protein n=1 Tax=Brachypodium distachyon TaxID=15368 RepID=A0A2K2CMI9_BRADI|nr:E3 ubiquitin-protein ligase RBBP6 isoform X2 [Brachypodium distachyon]PNT63236.1 hypothetical protein BRADI_4g13220v3 [Brachypodium distachyon]|eukprot:XP_014758166.1 E3 ubiquitin-protein ligase RBBP6 isoform X2 [Brachypodium distachyon]